MIPMSPTPHITTDSDPTEETKNNRPKDSKLRQQKLPAWQPILTAGTVVPSFLAVGLIFLPLGIVLYLSSEAVYEQAIDYTLCKKAGTQTLCKDVIRPNSSSRNTVWPPSCRCEISFNIEEDLKGPVYFYYGLSNFYQNHRRYVKSRSDVQLLGDLKSIAGCEPFTEAQNPADPNNPANTIKYAPCGSVANSLFNDTFALKGADGSAVNVTWQDVAWPSDLGNKFQNPAKGSGSLKDAFEGYARPPSWHLDPWQLDNTTDANNAFQNTDFIVWMRTAALPTFRKLWRRLSQPKMAAGAYTLEVDYAYPVSSFDGQKRFIVSTASWVGGKNSFLGVAYIVVGVLCLLLAVLFLAIHLKFGRSLTEMSTINAGQRS